MPLPEETIHVHTIRGSSTTSTVEDIASDLAVVPDFTDGACRDADPELWFSFDPIERREAAKACDACPVIEACARYAINTAATDGIWAGVDLYRDDQPLRRLAAIGRAPEPAPVEKRPRRTKSSAKHGTESGYQWHSTNKDTPCDPCREAHHIHRREQRRAAKQRKETTA